MVGHGEELAPYPFDIAYSIVREVVDSVVYAPANSFIHYFLLEFIYAVYGTQRVPKVSHRPVREQIFRNGENRGMVRYLPKGLYSLFVIVGTYIVKFSLVCHG